MVWIGKLSIYRQCLNPQYEDGFLVLPLAHGIFSDFGQYI
jgi:hypothetical protein